MIEGQTSIFEMLYPTFKLKKKIKLISLFSGYDSQALSLKYLGLPFEHWKTCEWAVKSIQALKDLHFEEDTKDYSKDIEIGQIKEFLLNKGISSNYNEPMSKEQINRLSEHQVRTIYNNIKATHNLVNIQQVKGADLEIKDTDQYDYILTYSFPCQDLSLAGTRKLMSDTSTRSGMLWEVERILTECKELGQLPSCLVMENVIQVHGEGAKQDFNRWQLKLEELGYKNYWQDLIATDYGIPQTRNRCFMVSVLGDYNYTFPKPIPLKLRLKDMLEDEVDDKYYLSDRGMEYICGNALNKDLKDRIDRSKTKLNKEIAYTITTKQDRRCGDANFILDGYGETSIRDFLQMKNDIDEPKILDDRDIGLNGIRMTDMCPTQRASRNGLKVIEPTNKSKDYNLRSENKNLIKTLEENNVEDGDYIDAYNHNVKKEVSGTILTGVSFRNQSFVATKDTKQFPKILIKNATKQGYLEATEGDGIDISSRMQYHRGTVQKGKTQTLSTMGGENNGVVVLKRGYSIEIKEEKENANGVDVLGNYSKSNFGQTQIVNKNGLAPTFTENHGEVTAIIDKPKVLGGIGEKKSNNGTQWYQHDRIYDDNVAITITTECNPYYKNDLRIRKLTPRECFRLMGVRDDDFNKVVKNQSDNSLYHLAGDSIVVNVLMAIFKEMI